VTLDGFWLDRTEVTNAQYARCVAEGACTQPSPAGSQARASYYGTPEFGAYPALYVSWNQAAEYCDWAGARLPTEAEWEYAARGPAGSVFPWGAEFDGARLNYCDAACAQDRADGVLDSEHDTAPVGSIPQGASWSGALDMAGNVWEWVADWYGDYLPEDQVNPPGPGSGEQRILRGGSWYDTPAFQRGANRFPWPADQPTDQIGFRCARGSD
jgi:serine/threonine-protein kinase